MAGADRFVAKPDGEVFLCFMNSRVARLVVSGILLSGCLSPLARGGWEDPVIVSDQLFAPERGTRAHVDPLGNVFAIFRASSFTERVAIRPAGGSFGTPQLPPSPGSWKGVRYAFAADGTGLLSWNDNSDNLRVTYREAGAGNDYGPTQLITTETPPGYTLLGHFRGCERIGGGGAGLL